MRYSTRQVFLDELKFYIAYHTRRKTKVVVRLFVRSRHHPEVDLFPSRILPSGQNGAHILDSERVDRIRISKLHFPKFNRIIMLFYYINNNEFNCLKSCLLPKIFTWLKMLQSLAAPQRQLMNLLSSGLSFATIDSLK